MERVDDMSEDPHRPTTDGGPDHVVTTDSKRHIPKLNELLIAARKATKSEHRPGKWMSQAEVADKANAYILARGGELMDDRVVSKLERGEIIAPRDELRREALRHVLGVKSDAELGWPPRRAPVTTTPAHGTTTAVCCDHAMTTPDAETDIGKMVSEAASDTEQVASATEARTVASTTLARYQARLTALSKDFVHRPAREVFPGLRSLWRDLSPHLLHGPRRHQSRDLYLLGGLTCVVMAHACHVLGRPLEGMVQVKAAQLWAEESGHAPLLAWTAGTEALLVEAISGPVEALHVLEGAQEILARTSRPGTGAVRLRGYEARFSAKAGQRDRALNAVRASEDAAAGLSVDTSSDLDAIGGILTFTEPKRLSFCADPFLSFGQPGRAEQHAQAAIAGYLAGPTEQCSYGDVALARATTALARLADGHLDGVEEALRPILDLPQTMRITPLKDPLERLVTALKQPRYQKSAEAARIRDRITEFCQPFRAIMSR